MLHKTNLKHQWNHTALNSITIIKSKTLFMYGKIFVINDGLGLVAQVKQNERQEDFSREDYFTQRIP